MYHPTIQKLDSVASDFHEMRMITEKNSAFRLAGQFQQELLKKSPYKTGRRFLHAQWVWALGHMGLLYQLIRWFKLKEPETKLVLLANGSANPEFLKALSPFLEIPETYNPDEAMRNAVYFGCPDGVNTLVNFYKMIEMECRGTLVLSLTNEQQSDLDDLMWELDIKHPYVAVHARATANDPARNVTVSQVEEFLEELKAKGYSIVITGLDQHPINAKCKNILDREEKHKASFLLSAGCDHFIGSDSGAWTVAHAFGKPVTLMNDYQRNAWIYPSEY